MSDVLLVQNKSTEGPGYLGRLLQDDGFDVLVADPRRESIQGGDHMLVVILGAPESANDCLPYLEAEQQLVRDCVKKETPLLGICLGSQLIARALGARVYRGSKREIGFYSDLRPCGTGRLFSGFGDPFTVFHWHGDTFELPDGAVRLASSEHYENQAFQYGSAVGLQFHLEADRDMIRLWLEDAAGTPEAPCDPGSILSGMDSQAGTVASNMNLFYSNFKSLFGL
ncbi:MAG: type 1 glutamine amidotransferase [Nitrosopumilus sp. H13]|nr:MAG: type 1 glutamine amidotransferase [Nitrosopumilus sp. H13]